MKNQKKTHLVCTVPEKDLESPIMALTLNSSDTMMASGQSLKRTLKEYFLCLAVKEPNSCNICCNGVLYGLNLTDCAT